LLKGFQKNEARQLIKIVDRGKNAKSNAHACLPRIENKNRKSAAKYKHTDLPNPEQAQQTSLLGPSFAVVNDTRLGLTILSTSAMSATLSNPTQRLLRPHRFSALQRSTYLLLNTNAQNTI
jgi:hypothetical protein